MKNKNSVTLGDLMKSKLGLDPDSHYSGQKYAVLSDMFKTMLIKNLNDSNRNKPNYKPVRLIEPIEGDYRVVYKGTPIKINPKYSLESIAKHVQRNIDNIEKGKKYSPKKSK